MKKLLIYLLICTGLNGFISATPCNCQKQKKSGEATIVTAKANTSIYETDEPEFHPLNIIGLRFQ